MERLVGENIFLRHLVMTDLEVLMRIENNKAFWSLSDTTSAFSEQMISEFLVNAQRDIRELKQLRFALCVRQTEEIVGLVDLFDYDVLHFRAGVGILIEDPENRQKGYAAEALDLLLAFAKEQLNLHQLYANILEDNVPSIALFEKQGFEKIGVKKEWRKAGKVFKNEILYQHIL